MICSDMCLRNRECWSHPQYTTRFSSDMHTVYQHHVLHTIPISCLRADFCIIRCRYLQAGWLTIGGLLIVGVSCDVAALAQPSSVMVRWQTLVVTFPVAFGSLRWVSTAGWSWWCVVQMYPSTSKRRASTLASCAIGCAACPMQL